MINGTLESIKRLSKDFTDRGALINQESLSLKNLAAGFMIIITTVVNFIKSIQDLLSTGLGIYQNCIPILLITASFYFAIYLIIAKVKIPKEPGLLPNSREIVRYKIPNKLRNLAKCIVVICALLLPFYVIQLSEDMYPMPKVIYGYLYDSVTSEPIKNAKINIVDKSGVTITDGRWFTDDNGFYIVKANSRFYRDSKLKVSVIESNSEFFLPLTRIFEKSDTLTPMFVHQIKI